MKRRSSTGQDPAAPPAMARACLAGRLWKGVYAFAPDGKPLVLAVVDDANNVIERGEAVSREAWQAALDAYWQHLRDLGFMIDHGGTPPAGGGARKITTPSA